MIAERNATTILRDPYTHKPYVHFYATKRVGGQVVNSESDQAAEVRLTLRGAGSATPLPHPPSAPRSGPSLSRKRERGSSN